MTSANETSQIDLSMLYLNIFGALEELTAGFARVAAGGGEMPAPHPGSRCKEKLSAQPRFGLGIRDLPHRTAVQITAYDASIDGCPEQVSRVGIAEDGAGGIAAGHLVGELEQGH